MTAVELGWKNRTDIEVRVSVDVYLSASYRQVGGSYIWKRADGLRSPIRNASIKGYVREGRLPCWKLPEYPDEVNHLVGAAAARGSHKKVGNGQQNHLAVLRESPETVPCPETKACVAWWSGRHFRPRR